MKRALGVVLTCAVGALLGGCMDQPDLYSRPPLSLGFGLGLGWHEPVADWDHPGSVQAPGIYAELLVREGPRADHALVLGYRHQDYPGHQYDEGWDAWDHDELRVSYRLYSGRARNVQWFLEGGLSTATAPGETYEDPVGGTLVECRLDDTGVLLGAGARWRLKGDLSRSFLDAVVNVVPRRELSAGSQLLTTSQAQFSLMVGWVLGGSPAWRARREEARRATFGADRVARERAALLADPTREAVPLLIELLGDRRWRTRRRAAVELGRLGPEAEDAAVALALLLGDTHPEVRLRAAGALVAIGPAAVPALARALEDADAGVRRRAADVLGWMGPPAKEAVPALSVALEDRDGRARTSAALALEKIQEEE